MVFFFRVYSHDPELILIPTFLGFQQFLADGHLLKKKKYISILIYIWRIPEEGVREIVTRGSAEIVTHHAVVISGDLYRKMDRDGVREVDLGNARGESERKGGRGYGKRTKWEILTYSVIEPG